MLITNDRDELTGHLYSVTAKERIWRQVSFELQAPYFLITYQIMDKSCTVIQTSLLWQLNDLLEFCSRIRSETGQSLKQITLLSPGWMNQKNTWQTNIIREIWSGKICGGKTHVITYITEDGQQLFDPETHDPHKEIRFQKMLFSFLPTDKAPANQS